MIGMLLQLTTSAAQPWAFMPIGMPPALLRHALFCLRDNKHVHVAVLLSKD